MIMNQELLKTAEKYHTKRHHRKSWHKVVGILGCLVVFCTTYALILPALTMEKESFCGMEEHTHEAACYAQVSAPRQPICTQESLGIHQHSAACVAADGSIVCGQADFIAHVHSDECFLADGTLWCPLAEVTTHTHGDGCYTPSDPGHTHTAECYTQQQGELVCTEPEVPGHAHGDDCYNHEQVLICTLEEKETSEPQLICTMQELTLHQHSGECFNAEGLPVCGKLQLTSHMHGEECFLVQESESEETQLACQLNEHTHQLICFSDPTADVESAADWEATLPQLSGVWADDLLAVAGSQLGYEESVKNYTVLSDGATMLGYSRYGDWYGYRYGDWCAMFVAFCLHYADIPQSCMPYDANCGTWVDLLKATGQFRTPDEYTPVPGDIIFFDYNNTAQADHVGIVSTVDTESGKLTAIEGNHTRTVDTFKYFLSESDILGYGVLPQSSGEQVLAQQTLNAVIYTDDTYTAEAEDGTVITVSGLIPEGSVVRAYPVELESDVVDGQLLVCAYDITIFDANGKPFEQSPGQDTFTVTIQPAGWTDTEEKGEDYTVYYIPETGEAEAMDTHSGEDAVSFTTDHFTTYALTTGGTADTVYLNGASGSDSNAGTSATGAVKTLEKAMALVKDGGTIYITGTVTVSDAQEWAFAGSNSVTIRRYSSFTGPLITVANGGELTVGKGVTIHGNSGTPNYSDSSPTIATNSTYANNSAKAPLIVVNNGGNLVLNDGVMLTNNSNKPDISSNKFVENGYVGLGGAVYCSGTMTMLGGTIQYCEAQCGGGVYVENGSFYLSGGLIDHNFARDIVPYKNRVANFHKNAGGGVYVGDNATMTMTGGTVSYNQSSREGGGISLGWLNRSNNSYINDYIAAFTMNGGTLDHNFAVSTGGGLNITAGRQAFINAGHITNNTAKGQEYQDTSSYVSAGSYCYVFSGGGIYIDARQWTTYPNSYRGVPGKAVINRALITANKATSDGGGIAACATSDNYLYYDVTLGNGAAIFGNTKGSSANEIYISGGDIELASTALGGGSYNWSQSSPYTNSLSKTNQEKARTLATVFIENNTGYLGGGIGCNGLIEVGGEKYESTYINIEKVWEDNGLVPHPEYIQVQILQNGKPYGDPVRIYRTYDANGNEIWPTFYMGGLPSGYTYTVEELEVPGYKATVAQNGQNFIITNKPIGFEVVKQWVGDEESDRPGSITVQLYQNGVSYGETVELTAAGGWIHIWNNLPKKDDNGSEYTYTAVEVSVPDGYYSTSPGQLNADGQWVITNTKSPTTVRSVEKVWADGTPGAASVTVQLLQNGNVYREVVLSAGNNWFHKWDDLPALDSAGNDIVYSVQEVPIPGYSFSVEETRWEIPETTTYSWEIVTSLEANTQYLLVASNGALAGDSESGLQWLDVSANLQDGTLPDDAALWTYSSSKLQNGDGKCLVLNSSGSWLSTTYTFATNSSGSNISFSNDRLSATGGYSTRYFSGISNNAGSTTTSAGSAVSFTAYKLTSETVPGSSTDHFIVTNTKKLPMLNVGFGKYSTGTDEHGNFILIEGADLELYRLIEDGDAVALNDPAGELIGQWTTQSASSDTSGNGGIMWFELTDGKYRLEETKAPPGHQILTAPIEFEIRDGAVINMKAPENAIGGVTADEDNTVLIPIYNTLVLELPETGGLGTHLYTTGGLLLMTAAVILLLYSQSKRRKEDFSSS